MEQDAPDELEASGPGTPPQGSCGCGIFSARGSEPPAGHGPTDRGIEEGTWVRPLSTAAGSSTASMRDGKALLWDPSSASRRESSRVEDAPALVRQLHSISTLAATGSWLPQIIVGALLLAAACTAASGGDRL